MKPNSLYKQKSFRQKTSTRFFGIAASANSFLQLMRVGFYFFFATAFFPYFLGTTKVFLGTMISFFVFSGKNILFSFKILQSSLVRETAISLCVAKSFRRFYLLDTLYV